jgi:putative DNA primase/helicase
MTSKHTPEEILNAYGITLKRYSVGRQYTTCPKCSAGRQRHHQKQKVLGVTIEKNNKVHFGCSHCSWSGPKKGITAKLNSKGYDHVSSSTSISATYDYEEADGKITTQKVRYANKTFKWRRPNGRGGWAWGTAGARKVLYHLPDLIAAIKDGRTIVVVEGEKDAGNLRALGFVATCSPDGASDPTKNQKPKWVPAYSEMLRGADVVVLGDNDDAGGAHVEATASMSTGIAKRVRVIDLARHWPDCPEGGDISDWIKAGHTREELEALIQGAPDYVAKTEIEQGIYVVNGQIARVVDEAEDGLIAKGVPILVRANALVQPIVTKLPTNGRRMTEATLLRALSTHNIVYLLNKNGIVFLRFNTKSGEWLEIDPPAKVALSLLVKGEWQFPRVAGVITVPTLRPDGTILDQPGYDPATQLWYAADSDFKMPPVSEKPTREEALAALDLLEGLLKEFPFISEADRSVALAAMLTAILRGAFDVAPMFLIIAPSPGSGKSFLINLISNMVRGQDCPVITNCKSIEEMEKRLGALVLEGAPMINLDNCSEDIGGDLLCQITEQRIIRIRILGKSEAPQCEWRGVMCATGNNVRLVGDMTRRGLICNIDSQLEQPEQREFKFQPIEQVLSNRGAYIAAALTIVRAYIAAGCPDNCGPLASYGPWSKNVRAPLIWLSKEDPVKSMEQARDLDPVRNAARALVAVWNNELQAGVSYSAAELIEEADEKKREKTNMIDDKGETMYEYVWVRPSLRALLLEQAGTHRGEIDAVKLGRWLKSVRNQVHDGHRIEITKETTRGHRYCLKRVA